MVDSSRPLRGWQRRALASYVSAQPRDFLAVATPGAGKTTFGLRVATELLRSRVVDSLTVVTPTEHLKHQWATAAAEVGIPIDPEFRNTAGATSSDYRGVAVTYAQVGAHPALHRVRTEARPTLVVLDEIHHAGDARTWGEAIREAFDSAQRRLALTGTPFRSDDTPIPFVVYEPEPGGTARSKANHTYGYAEALRDGVVRPVIFMAYSGEASWRDSAGEEFSARLGEPLTAEQTARAWRTALDPAGEWIPTVLAAADTRLSRKRADGIPDAGGLVIASDHDAARAYAKILHRITGAEPALVLSDDPKASSRIGQFARSNDRWLVAVRMVSEGVDVPRLAVGVYATSASTPLFFAQAVGRFVRARRPGETASVFLPSVPALLDLASQLEAERDHVLGRPHRSKEGWDDELVAAANAQRDEPGEAERAFTALGASAELDQVIFDGSSFGTAALAASEEEQEYLGLPGLLEPDQMRTLLRLRQERQLAKAASKPVGAGAPDSASAGRAAEGQAAGGQAAGGQAAGGQAVGGRAVGDQAAGGQAAAGRAAADSTAAGPESVDSGPVGVRERLIALRKELNALVALHHHRTGKGHGIIHSELRRSCGGPPTAMASAKQLQDRIATLRTW